MFGIEVIRKESQRDIAGIILFSLSKINLIVSNITNHFQLHATKFAGIGSFIAHKNYCKRWWNMHITPVKDVTEQITFITQPTRLKMMVLYILLCTNMLHNNTKNCKSEDRVWYYHGSTFKLFYYAVFIKDNKCIQTFFFNDISISTNN